MTQVQSMYSNSSYVGRNRMNDSFTIHSGQFMNSRVHEEKDDDYDDDDETHVTVKKVTAGYDFVEAKKETSQTYTFGPQSTATSLPIDESLTKVFECMTLAYSGKITSPKWKPFRGMHLSGKDKVRLNNIIWREWHIQYIFQKPSLVCQFATPFSDDIHTKPEAVVMEGKYWKRRLDIVTNEYMKWRRYYRDRIMPTMSKGSHVSASLNGLTEEELLDRLKDVSAIPSSLQQDARKHSLLGQDSMDVDFSDNLFSYLNQPFAFPNPRELSQFGQLLCADVIQPGLVQLQPILDDFMDLDSVPDLLTRATGVNNTPVACGQLTSNLQSSRPLAHSSLPNTGDMLDPLVGAGYSTDTVHPRMGTTWNAPLPSASTVSREDRPVSVDPVTARKALLPPDPALPVTNTWTSPPGHLNTAVAMDLDVHTSENGMSLPVLTLPAESTGALHQKAALQEISKHEHATDTVNLSTLGLILSSVLPKPSYLQHSSSSVGPPSAERRLTAAVETHGVNSPSPVTSVGGGPVPPTHKAEPVTTAATLIHLPVNNQFAVPQAKPASLPWKPRPIAPAPAPSPTSPAPSVSPSPSINNSCLARLLRDGVYSGAIIKVEEGSNPPVIGRQPPSDVGPSQPVVSVRAPLFLAPAPAQGSSAPGSGRRASDGLTSPSPGTDTENGMDFPTRVMMAAANSVLGSPSSIPLPGIPTGTLTALLTAGLDNRCSSADGAPARSSTTISVSSPLASSGTSPCRPAQATCLDDDTSAGSGSLSRLPNLREGFSEHRRTAHQTAEQRRRGSLKTGLDVLHTLVPSLSSSSKTSEANKLQKTAEHLRKMKVERIEMQNEARILKAEIDALKEALSEVQSQLPETGVPVTRQRMTHMKEMFDSYVQQQTMQDWKFGIFSRIVQEMFNSFSNTVSTSSKEEFIRTITLWLDQHCSLRKLRDETVKALVQLCTSTSILSAPDSIQDLVLQSASGGHKQAHKRLAS